MVQQATAVDVTAAGILNDLELDFKLAVVATRLGHNGIMQLIDGWIRDGGRAGHALSRRAGGATRCQDGRARRRRGSPLDRRVWRRGCTAR